MLLGGKSNKMWNHLTKEVTVDFSQKIGMRKKNTVDWVYTVDGLVILVLSKSHCMCSFWIM